MNKSKKNLKCHPKKDNETYSCYDYEQLLKIANTLNKNGYNIKIYKTKKALWEEINKHMKDKCSKEWCWIEQPEIKKIDDEELHQDTFRPEHPEEWKKNKKTWLTNFDIDAVMSQYEDIYPDFKFFGPVPIDFEDIYTELTNVNLGNLYKKNIKKIGIVFNLDPHYKSGSHWVAMFLNMTEPDKAIVAFYDSYGIEPDKLIIDLMSKFIIQGYQSNIDNIDIEPLFNPIQHQHENSECGVYSINFIVSMLKNNGLKSNFFQICKDIIDDKTMNSFREIYFRDDGKI